MPWFMIDIEADGPIPGDYSMIELGAVLIDPEGKLDVTFHGKLRPISDKYMKEALNVTLTSRADTFGYDHPKHVMEQFFDWIIENSKGRRARFLSDNNGFDWMFVCWYFWHFLEKNPFGHSSTNLGSLYKGMAGTIFENFKHLRITPHTHNPVEDARGNAEALLHMIKEMGLRFDLKS